MSSHLDVALELADIADSITQARFRAPDLRVDTKSDSTPVTDADRTTEQALRDALQRLFRLQDSYGVSEAFQIFRKTPLIRATKEPLG